MKITLEELQAFVAVVDGGSITAAADTLGQTVSGISRALARLGLSDAAAEKDMAELRELLGAWRDAKKSAWKALFGWAARMVAALLLVGLAVRLGYADYVK